MNLVRPIRMLLLALACAAWAGAVGAAGVPLTLQYQGRLTDATSGAPLNGAQDLVFSIWDAPGPSGGTQLWTQTFNATTLVSGQFTVVFDFTQANSYRVVNAIAAGGKVYVQTAVGGTNLNGTGTTVARQEITSVLSSLRAQQADSAKAVGAGAAVTSLNTLRDAVTLAAGGGVTVTPGGQTLTLGLSNVSGTVLQNATVASTKVSDEPGVGYGFRLGPISIGSANYRTVDSVSITSPGPGYVVVEGTVSLRIQGAAPSSAEAWCAIGTGADRDPASHAVAGVMGLAHVSVTDTATPGASNYFSVHTLRVYPTSGGSQLFFLNVSGPSSAEASYASMSARYYPTAYGDTPTLP